MPVFGAHAILEQTLQVTLRRPADTLNRIYRAATVRMPHVKETNCGQLQFG